MIAFDIDGVLQPDILYSPTTFDMLRGARTHHLFPILQPIGDYMLITARLEADANYTNKWAQTFLNVQPKKIIHRENLSQDSAEYKATTLHSHKEITLYVESDEDIVNSIIQYRVKCKVIHFNTWVLDLLSRESCLLNA